MSTATSYDELPYGDNPFYQTHPDCLATAAVLHGLKPPEVPTCRVLELGCARGVLREMMVYAVEAVPDPQARVEQARGFLGFLMRSIPNQNSTYASMLKKEVDVLAAETDTYLFHEFLEEVNQPVYFHEFARRI